MSTLHHGYIMFTTTTNAAKYYTGIHKMSHSRLWCQWCLLDIEFFKILIFSYRTGQCGNHMYSMWIPGGFHLVCTIQLPQKTDMWNVQKLCHWCLWCYQEDALNAYLPRTGEHGHHMNSRWILDRFHIMFSVTSIIPFVLLTCQTSIRDTCHRLAEY